LLIAGFNPECRRRRDHIQQGNRARGEWIDQYWGSIPTHLVMDIPGYFLAP
jgi:hypothetical protein